MEACLAGNIYTSQIYEIQIKAVQKKRNGLFFVFIIFWLVSIESLNSVEPGYKENKLPSGRFLFKHPLYAFIYL